MRAYNFGVNGHNLAKLPADVARSRSDNVDSNFARGAPTKFGKRDFCQLSTLSANNSGTDQHGENLKSTTTHSTLGAKNLVIFGPQTKKL